MRGALAKILRFKRSRLAIYLRLLFRDRFAVVITLHLDLLVGNGLLLAVTEDDHAHENLEDVVGICVTDHGEQPHSYGEDDEHREDGVQTDEAGEVAENLGRHGHGRKDARLGRVVRNDERFLETVLQDELRVL